MKLFVLQAFRGLQFSILILNMLAARVYYREKGEQLSAMYFEVKYAISLGVTRDGNATLATVETSNQWSVLSSRREITAWSLLILKDST
jgi:hypothetical protein